MRFLIHGVPRATSPFVLDPAQQTVALLGRETDENRGRLDIPLPHIDLGETEPPTVRWSREHARFEFVRGSWHVTFIGREPTLLDGRELVPTKPTPLGSDKATLECGGLTLRLTRVAANPNDTLCGGETRRPAAGVNETVVSPLKPGGADRPLPPVRHRPLDPRLLRGEHMVAQETGTAKASALADRVRDLLKQIAEDAARARASAQDAQQHRQNAETARDEIQRGLPEVRSATLLSQIQDAARRASEATARAQTAATKAAACGDYAERALESCTKREQELRSLVADLRATGMSERSSGADFSIQIDDQKREAERYVEQAGQHRAETRRAGEQAQAATRAGSNHNEQVQKAASERQGELQRKERALVAIRRYGIIALLFLVATAIGLLIGSFVEPKG